MTNSDLKSRFDKSVEFFKNELSQIRTGRAYPGLVENVEVMAYDSKMKIKELGSISLLDTQTLAVVPWDRSLLGAIAAAIRDSEMKLSPITDPDRVRVPVPPLTEERRKEFGKLVSSKSEEVKNNMRTVRQEAMKDIDKLFAEKKMGEDDKFKQKEDVEKITKEYVSKIDELADTKKSELMAI